MRSRRGRERAPTPYLLGGTSVMESVPTRISPTVVAPRRRTFVPVGDTCIPLAKMKQRRSGSLSPLTSSTTDRWIGAPAMVVEETSTDVLASKAGLLRIATG